MTRAIGNPDTGADSELSFALEQAIEQGDIAAANDAAGKVRTELDAARQEALRIARWPEGAGAAEEMDRLLTAFDAYVAALVAAAPQGMADARTAAQHAFEAEAETARADVAIWTSPDGSHWQRVPHDAGFVAGDVEGMQYGAFSLAVSGDSIVIVGRTTGPQTTIWLDK